MVVINRCQSVGSIRMSVVYEYIEIAKIQNREERLRAIQEKFPRELKAQVHSGDKKKKEPPGDEHSKREVLEELIELRKRVEELEADRAEYLLKDPLNQAFYYEEQ